MLIHVNHAPDGVEPHIIISKPPGFISGLVTSPHSLLNQPQRVSALFGYLQLDQRASEGSSYELEIAPLRNSTFTQNKETRSGISSSAWPIERVASPVNPLGHLTPAFRTCSLRPAGGCGQGTERHHNVPGGSHAPDSPPCVA